MCQKLLQIVAKIGGCTAAKAGPDSAQPRHWGRLLAGRGRENDIALLDDIPHLIHASHLPITLWPWQVLD